MRKFENGDQVVIGGRHFGDETKYCTVMAYREVGAQKEYLVVKVSATYTEWVPERYVNDPNEMLLDGNDEFLQHGVEMEKLCEERKVLIEREEKKECEVSTGTASLKRSK